jgi:hypothetical protein
VRAHDLHKGIYEEMAGTSKGKGFKEIMLLVDGDLIPVESVQWDPENDVFVIIGTG